MATADWSKFGKPEYTFYKIPSGEVIMIKDLSEWQKKEYARTGGYTEVYEAPAGSTSFAQTSRGYSIPSQPSETVTTKVWTVGGKEFSTEAKALEYREQLYKEGEKEAIEKVMEQSFTTYEEAKKAIETVQGRTEWLKASKPEREQMSYADTEKNIQVEKKYIEELRKWAGKLPTGTSITRESGEISIEEFQKELAQKAAELGELRKKAARIKQIEKETKEKGLKEQISREVAIGFPELPTKPKPKTVFEKIGEGIWDIKEYTTQEHIKKLDKSFGTFGAAREEFDYPRFTIGEQAVSLAKFGEAVFEFAAITFPSYYEQTGLFLAGLTGGTAEEAAFEITPEGKRKSFGFEWTPLFTGPEAEFQKSAVKLGLELGYVWYPAAKGAVQLVKEAPYILAGKQIGKYKIGEVYPSKVVVKTKVQPFKTKVDYKTAFTVIPDEALYTQKVKFLGKQYQRTFKITGAELEAMKGIGKQVTGEIIFEGFPTGKKGSISETVSIKGPKEFYGQTFSFPTTADDIYFQIGALDIKEEASLYLGTAKKVPKEFISKDAFFTKGFIVSPEGKITADVVTRVEVLKAKDLFQGADKVLSFKGGGTGTGIAGIKKQFLMQTFLKDYATTSPIIAAQAKTIGAGVAAKGLVGIKDTGTILSGAGMFAAKSQEYFSTEEIEYEPLALKGPKVETGLRTFGVKYDFGLKPSQREKISVGEMPKFKSPTVDFAKLGSGKREKLSYDFRYDIGEIEKVDYGEIEKVDYGEIEKVDYDFKYDFGLPDITPSEPGLKGSGILLPPLLFGGGKRISKRRAKIKAPPKYKPTLEAWGRGIKITRKEYEKRYKGRMFTGLEVRPMIVEEIKKPAKLKKLKIKKFRKMKLKF